MKYLPNILSVFRICLVPVFIVMFLRGNYPVSVAVILVSAASDMADGYIARKFGFVSVTGQVLDPLADKLMQLSVIFMLWIHEFIPTWVILIVAFKELVMIVGGCVLYFSKKKNTIPAMWYGKISTCLFYLTVVLVIMFRDAPFITPLIVVTVGFMVFSLCMYLARYFSMSKKSVNG